MRSGEGALELAGGDPRDAPLMVRISSVLRGGRDRLAAVCDFRHKAGSEDFTAQLRKVGSGCLLESPRALMSAGLGCATQRICLIWSS